MEANIENYVIGSHAIAFEGEDSLYEVLDESPENQIVVARQEYRDFLALLRGNSGYANMLIEEFRFSTLRLTPGESDVFNYALRGFSPRETAKEMGAPYGSVRTRISSAMKKLREMHDEFQQAEQERAAYEEVMSSIDGELLGRLSGSGSVNISIDEMVEMASRYNVFVENLFDCIEQIEAAARDAKGFDLGR